MRRLSQRESRLVAVLLLVGIIAVGWLLLIAPVIDGFAERREARDALRLTYARNARLINAVPAMRRRAEQLEAASGDFVLRAPGAAVARDRLRTRLRTALVASGGQVTAAQDIPAPAGQARAWVQGRMTLAQLNQMLATLSNTPPYLIIESVRVTADRALQTGQLDSLDIRLEASIPLAAAAS